MGRKKKRVGLATKIFVVAFSIYAAFTLISIQVQISGKRAEQEQLMAELESKALRNAELEAATKGGIDDETVAGIARDSLDYVFPGEQVFVDISSN